jgi:hypothetical protein
MALQTVSARSGGLVGTFELDWETHRWTSQSQVHFEEGDFPFVAEIGKGRFELYSDHTFGEAEVDTLALSRLKRPTAVEPLHEPLR